MPHTTTLTPPPLPAPAPAAARSRCRSSGSADICDVICRPPHHDLQSLPPGAQVLDPHAGDGRLVAAILAVNPVLTVTAVSPAPASTVNAQVRVVVSPFDAYAARCLRTGAAFDAVVMRPPFTLPGQADVWFDHLRLAWRLLAPDARLTAVVPAGFAHRCRDVADEARTFVETRGTHDLLPIGAAAIPVRVVRLTKPVTGSGSRDGVHLSSLALSPVTTRAGH